MHGLNDRRKRVLVRSLLRSVRADVVCLQEAKMEYMGEGEFVKELWGGHFVDWTFLPASGWQGVFFCIGIGEW